MTKIIHDDGCRIEPEPQRSCDNGLVRRRRAIPIAEILQKAVPQKARARLFSVDLVRRGWSEVVGRDLAKRSEPCALSNGVLTVRVGDARWGRMIHQLQNRIIPKLNAQIGLPLVRRINFARYAGAPVSTHNEIAPVSDPLPAMETPASIQRATDSLTKSLDDAELGKLLERVAVRELQRRAARSEDQAKG